MDNQVITLGLTLAAGLICWSWLKESKHTQQYSKKTGKTYLVKVGDEQQQAADMLAELEIRASVLSKTMGFNTNGLRFRELVDG